MLLVFAARIGRSRYDDEQNDDADDDDNDDDDDDGDNNDDMMEEEEPRSMLLVVAVRIGRSRTRTVGLVVAAQHSRLFFKIIKVFAKEVCLQFICHNHYIVIYKEIVYMPNNFENLSIMGKYILCF